MLTPPHTLDAGRLAAAYRLFVPFVFLVLTACSSGPPVQEMSDARQAIAVARQAGAEELAAEPLRAAEAYLDSAQRNLSERAYSQARRDALQAKLKALDALAMSENPARNRLR